MTQFGTPPNYGIEPKPHTQPTFSESFLDAFSLFCRLRRILCVVNEELVDIFDARNTVQILSCTLRDLLFSDFIQLCALFQLFYAVTFLFNISNFFNVLFLILKLSNIITREYSA